MDQRIAMHFEGSKKAHALAPWWWRLWQQVTWRLDYVRAALTGKPSKGELILIDIIKRNRHERRASASIARKLDRKAQAKRVRA